MDKSAKDMEHFESQNNNHLGQNFWNSNWKEQNTGWDIGYAAPAITEYLKQYSNENAAILIPGCGNAYEAEFLVKEGFSNITLIDIAPKAVEILQEKFKNTPQVQLICGDFFEHKGKYDLIIEQTFFCALPPEKRPAYAKKMASLLNDDGKIIGLLFDTTFEKQGPPFGGSTEEYVPVFRPYFHIKVMERCYNSIPPRANSEVFINLLKR